MPARHVTLTTTQRYTEADVSAMKMGVEIWGRSKINLSIFKKVRRCPTLGVRGSRSKVWESTVQFTRSFCALETEFCFMSKNKRDDLASLIVLEGREYVFE